METQDLQEEKSLLIRMEEKAHGGGAFWKDPSGIVVPLMLHVIAKT
jgi:hypothetical protein